MLTPSKNLSTKTKGFTLIETLIVITIMATVFLTLSYTIQYFYRTNNYVLQETTAVGSARNGLNTAMQNLREASYGDDGSYPIANAATSTITFYANVNGGSSVEKITMYLQGTTLYETITDSTGSPPTYPSTPTVTNTISIYVVNGTSTPIFQYYDSNGNLLSDPINLTSVASIGTSLKIDVDPNRAPVVYTLLGTATLRNLRGH